MEQQETVTPRRWRVMAIQTGDTLGGSIEKGDARYTMQMMPVSKAMVGGLIYDEHYDRFGGFRMVVH